MTAITTVTSAAICARGACIDARPDKDRRRPRYLAVRTSDGIRLGCTEYGERTACRTIVFLHGLCLSQVSWTPHIAYMLRRHSGAVRVISYDHRGHGHSQHAPVGTYSIEQLNEDLAHVVAQLDINGSVTFVGHSLGAMVALGYLGRPARERPVDPDGLVLVATAAGRLVEHGLGRLLATPGIGALCRLVEHAPEQALRALTTPVCGAIGKCWGCGHTQRATLAAVASAALMTTPASTAVGFLPALRTFDAYPTLGSIRARTVVVSGSADLLTPPVHARALAAAIPGAVHVCVPGAGHMLAQQAPHVVASAIDRAIAPQRCAISAARAERHNAQAKIIGRQALLGPGHPAAPRL
jgi:pimeloyl-ACP methyl ester carboxylesterase